MGVACGSRIIFTKHKSDPGSKLLSTHPTRSGRPRRPAGVGLRRDLQRGPAEAVLGVTLRAVGAQQPDQRTVVGVSADVETALQVVVAAMVTGVRAVAAQPLVL